MDKIISVIGHTAYDHLFDIIRFADINSSMPIAGYHIYFGGGAANIAAGIARLGGLSQLISPVGGDFNHSDYEHHLERLGVDTSLICLLYTSPSPRD